MAWGIGLQLACHEGGTEWRISWFTYCPPQGRACQVFPGCWERLQEDMEEKKTTHFSCWSSHPAMLEKEKSSGKEKIHFYKIQMMYTVGCWLKVVHIAYWHTSSTGGHHMNTHFNISISAKPWGVVYSCWNYFFNVYLLRLIVGL